MTEGSQTSKELPIRMTELRVQDLTEDELLRQIESSATAAVQRELNSLRETISRLEQSAYLQKTWLTLKEAARYADITTATLREWREEGLRTAERGGWKYIKREDLDLFIGEGSH